ncbi:MAG TPA: hypothetical protein VGM64_16470 [Lacunisphaera sp.]|jgi:hypothetical protein
MAKSAVDPHKFVSQISLVGRSGGAVKTLTGFKKQHHTLPDAVNPSTTAFLGKLCANELAAEGEDFFQRAKAALGYKRADLALEVTSPSAQLTAKDFVFELSYALEKTEPERYAITRTLHSLRSGNLIELPEFDELFAGIFSAIVFGLTKGARVEAVIDAIEALDDETTLTVSYPSDCRHCVLQVENVAAEVVCDGATLEMRFPKNGSPRELVAGFGEVRAAFALTKNHVLAGLL